MGNKWWRLCVDVDTEGNVVGCSVEHHVDDDVKRLDVGFVDPFATPSEHIEWMAVMLPVQLRML